MTGFIHSKETFGTVDGPGIRYVIFMQGCPMRCLYCHNPDTWDISSGRAVTADELLEEYKKNSVFYKNGGITVTGGEPLLQTEFLTELFIKAKEQNIHTCIDTSGITFSQSSVSYIQKLKKLLKYTDLIMLDIKHIDPIKHKLLTGKDNKGILNFAKFIDKYGVSIWIRHVVVEGYTDDPKYLKELGRFIGTLKNLKAIDVLPYHNMGEVKYMELGIDYPLKGMPSLQKQIAQKAKQFILEGIKEVKKGSL